MSLVEHGRRMPWLLLIVLAVAVGIAEAVGAILVYTLLSVVMGAADAVPAPLMAVLGAVGSTPSEQLSWLAVVVGVFFALRAGLVLLQSYTQNLLAWRTGTHLSVRLLGGYLQLPYVVYLRRNSAEYVRNCYDTVTQVVSQVLVPSVMVASEALLVAAMSAVLLFVAPQQTIIAAVVLGPAVFALLRLVRPALDRLGAENQEAVSRTFQSLQQTLHGMRDIRVYGKTRYFVDRYAADHRRVAASQTGRAFMIDLPRVVLETVLMLGIVTFVAVVARRGVLGDALAVLGMFAYTALRLMPSLHRLTTQVNHLRYGQPALRILMDDLAELKREASPARPQHERGGRGSITFEREIVFQDVSFRYEDAREEALSGVSLRVSKGESIGVVGPTGGGKSTLVDLLLGLLQPSTGQITVDGNDITSDPAAWQALLGVVPQSIFLIDDTLRHNIALGLRDEGIDEERLRESAALAQMDFVDSLPDGFDTPIGERGIRLSGGQRQRVAIARALYVRPSVLVFDEGTSALDNATEAGLIHALEGLRRRHTLVVVAHRLSTVRPCDRILVLENGRISDVGGYDELAQRSPAFKRLLQGESSPHTSR